MSTSRLRNPSIPKSPNSTDGPSTPSIIPQKKEKKAFSDILQSLGLLSLILLIVFIGFQMTSNDIYSDLHKDDIAIIDIPAKSTPSPSSSTIELIVHEDDGDLEIDVPAKIPPDQIPQNKQNIDKQKRARMSPKELFGVFQNRRSQRSNMTRHNTKRRPHYGKSLINIRSQPSDSTLPKTLPSIEEISKNASRRFYSDITAEATVHGMEGKCSKCPKRQFAIISGLYNTGTNVAFRLIAPNCRTQVKFQPGWGKHEMFNDTKIEHFNTHDYPSSLAGTYDNAILVIVIKDPLTWFKSMCKANYDFRYFNRSWFFESCPTNTKNSRFNWLPMNRGKVMNRGANQTSNGVYESPIHLWNDWVSNVVYNVDKERWPHMIVRFEDLLFRPKSVVPQFCKCLGACKFRPNVSENKIRVQETVSKPHGNARNRTVSFWAYSNPEFRYEGYTKEDLQYMLDVIDPRLLEKFGYEFDVEKTKRMRL